MADFNSLAPYLFTLMAGAVAWLFRTVIQAGKDIVRLETAIKFYIDGVGKGAAMVLDKPNPTPPEISRLLKKYYERSVKLDSAEREQLKEYLHKLVDDPDVRPGDRSAAIQLLVGMETLKLIPRHGHH